MTTTRYLSSHKWRDLQRRHEILWQGSPPFNPALLVWLQLDKQRICPRWVALVPFTLCAPLRGRGRFQYSSQQLDEMKRSLDVKRLRNSDLIIAVMSGDIVGEDLYLLRTMKYASR